MIACSLGDNGIANPGESCAFTCDDGFQINGNIGRTCQNDGKWSGAGTTCSRGMYVCIMTIPMTVIDPCDS